MSPVPKINRKAVTTAVREEVKRVESRNAKPMRQLHQRK